jgi:hypothetical protein
MQCADTSSDPVLSLILKGASNLQFSQPSKPLTRRIVTLPLLLTIGHRISLTDWSQQSKQVVWSACTTAFFPSARLGELLSAQQSSHDPTSDLTWNDVQFTSPTSVLIRLKNSKTGDIQGDFLDIFPFPNHQCCPVASLHALHNQQLAIGMALPNTPVFRFASGKNLTPKKLNSILAAMLADICSPTTNTITCHSFRAGIPTALSLHPDLASSDDIKGWGRWQSDCYSRYTRLWHDQKRAIFKKISAAIALQVCKLPTIK